MALIPKFHTSVSMFSVDPADVTNINSGSSLSTTEIHQGMVVGVNSSGYVKRASSSVKPIGLAGDSLAATAGHGAYSASLIVNPGGSTKSTQNRVSDYFNETLGSGLMTIYTVGGEFYTDMYESTNVSNGVTQTWTTGSSVYVSQTNATTAGYINTTAAGVQVGILTSYPGTGKYPSGVPGAAVSADFSMPLAPAGDANTVNSATNFIGFILSIQN